MASRAWTETDEEISKSKQYFVLTVHIPWASSKRQIKHLWGPAPYHRARALKKQLEEDFKSQPGTTIVDVIRWRGTI